MKKSFRVVLYGVVLKCFVTLICCSSTPNQKDEVEQQSYFTAGNSSLKRLGLHIQCPTCHPHLKNKDENALAKLSLQGKQKEGFNVVQEGFHFSSGMLKKKKTFGLFWEGDEFFSVAVIGHFSTLFYSK